MKNRKGFYLCVLGLCVTAVPLFGPVRRAVEWAAAIESKGREKTVE